MILEGTVMIEAPQEKVWTHLTNPEVVSQCAPGLVSMQIITPEKKFKVVAGIGFGSVKVTFDVDIEWQDLHPPESASLKAHGSAPGSAVDVTSGMHLRAIGPSQTELIWTADVAIVGTIASMASRLMSGLTRKLSASFFDCFKMKIEEITNIQG